jgi:hypothetical protein
MFPRIAKCFTSENIYSKTVSIMSEGKNLIRCGKSVTPETWDDLNRQWSNFTYPKEDEVSLMKREIAKHEYNYHTVGKAYREWENAEHPYN